MSDQRRFAIVLTADGSHIRGRAAGNVTHTSKVDG